MILSEFVIAGSKRICPSVKSAVAPFTSRSACGRASAAINDLRSGYFRRRVRSITLLPSATPYCAARPARKDRNLIVLYLPEADRNSRFSWGLSLLFPKLFQGRFYG